MAKQYSRETFHITMPDGKVLSFYCWTTDTRNGFCHTAWCPEYDQTTKASYWNRTWECYDYQSVLQKAFEKLRKAEREACKLWDIAHANQVSEECEAFVEQFKKVYEKTPKEFKEQLANSGIILQTKKGANVLMNVMEMATAVNLAKRGKGA